MALIAHIPGISTSPDITGKWCGNFHNPFCYFVSHNSQAAPLLSLERSARWEVQKVFASIPLAEKPQESVNKEPGPKKRITPAVGSVGWDQSEGARMDWGIPPGGIASSVELETAVPALVSCEVDTTSAATTVSLRRSARRVGYSGVSVIIVNYYQWTNTRQLLRQLQHCSAWSRGQIRVVVVDNGGGGTSWTDTVGGIRVRYESRNLGFAGGVNRGVRELDRWRWGIWRTDSPVYEWFLLLNPDVTVPAGFLDAVLDIVEQLTVEEPRAGVVGLRLCNPDSSLQGSCGRFPTLGSTLRGLLRPRAWRKCQMVNTQQRQQVDWVTGGCLLVRRDCFEQLGGLDESFFLYYEDVDFCHRAKAAGWQVLYEPRITVTHHWPLHARGVPAPLRLITRHALMQFARKHWGRWSNWCLRRLVWFEALCRAGWAHLCGRHRDGACYQQLRYLVQDISQERLHSISQRLAFASRYLRKIAAAQGLVPNRNE